MVDFDHSLMKLGFWALNGLLRTVVTCSQQINNQVTTRSQHTMLIQTPLFEQISKIFKAINQTKPFN